MEGFRKFKDALANAGLGHIKIGMRSIFKDSNLVRVKDVTSIRPLTAEEQKLEDDAKEEEAKRPPTNENTGGKPAKGAAVAKDLGSSSMSYRGPNHDKFIPNCINIRTGPLSTISDVLDFLRYSANLSDDNRFTLIIDDQVNQEVQSELDCFNVDLAMGLGCEYVFLRGCSKPERIMKIQHYAQYAREAATE